MLTFLAIVLLFPWIQVLAQTCSSSYSLRNMRLKGHVLKTHTAIQASDRCIDKCAWQTGCSSINYCSSQGICELNNASHLSNPESLVFSSGYEYLNYFFRVVSRCSNKLCSYPLECEVDNNGQDYKCNSFDNQWHHMCVTWRNVDGNYSMYVDGVSKGKGTKKAGHVIKKGAVVLGQDQDSYKGGFQATSSFKGNMTSVNMWDKVLTADEIIALANRCSTDEGNIIKWRDFYDKISGNLNLACSRFCDD